MTPFSRYIFVKTDMSGVEQADLSNREYSPDRYLFYHLAAEQSLKVYTEGFRVLLLNETVISCKSINLYPIV